MKNRAAELRELAVLFLRLGTTAFGGPAAHIAMMEREVVGRKGWLTREAFLDLLGATNLIPGPNSTEMAIHIGRLRAGWAGLLVAGSCFILPAALIVGAIAWAYATYGQLPPAAGLLYGVKPVVFAVVLQALWRLGGTALKTPALAAVCAAAAALNLAGVGELVLLFGAGALLAARRAAAAGGKGTFPAVLLAGAVVPAASGAVPFGLGPLFWFFAKVGSVLFGSGYVLLAFLRADLVERFQWITEAQLLDAIAVGQMTPGPVFTSATFIGYLLSGTAGALAATAGIFLPGFLFVAASGPLIPFLRRRPAAGAFLDGVNAASLALMAVVLLRLSGAAFVDVYSVALGIGAAVLLLRFGVGSTWLIAGGALAGIVIDQLRVL